MPVETPSIFSKIIEEHLELKRQNAELEGNLPLSRYVNDDPFQNHPLFKTEEQARLEETMDGALPAVTPEPALDPEPALAAEPVFDAEPALPELAETVEPEEALQAWTEAAAIPALDVHASAPAQDDDGLWGRSRDYDWGD
jgi:hypothetical protein